MRCWSTPATGAATHTWAKLPAAQILAWLVIQVVQTSTLAYCAFCGALFVSENALEQPAALLAVQAFVVVRALDDVSVLQRRPRDANDTSTVLAIAEQVLHRRTVTKNCVGVFGVGYRC
jgi:hypothetical protein